MKEIVYSPRRETLQRCSILVGKGMLSRMPGIIHRKAQARRYFIISDSNVARLYGKTLKQDFRKAGLEADLLVFPAGERNKNRRSKQLLEDRLLDAGADRDAVIVALGGGVTGDLAGFVASTFKRGIPYVQIPTSLLAQVDSSVGGKTAINTKSGKNLIGTFHQPQLILIDIDTLKTLPGEEFIAALGEVVKYAVIRDLHLFRYLEAHDRALMKRRPDILLHIIGQCCHIKSRVVSRDEKERNFRKILNFGHTIGHAIEHRTGYRLRHGEAVSIGMMLESELAVKLGWLSPHAIPRLSALLQKLQLPLVLPDSLSTSNFLQALTMDKKNRAGQIGFVFPASIGRMKKKNGNYTFLIEPARLRKLLSR